MQIIEDDLRGPEIAALLAQHLEAMAVHSPPESRHALDLGALRAPDITFWTAWEGPDLLGCSALRELDLHHGEIKSMHTAKAHRGRGTGVAMLAHIITTAHARGYRRLSLETGSMATFAPSRTLYARFGFAPCPPFAAYRPDINSICMTRPLDPGACPPGFPLPRLCARNTGLRRTTGATMSKRDDRIALYAKDIREKCGMTPDMDLLTKVTIGCGPSIYRRDSAIVAGSDTKELATIQKNFLMKKLGLADSPKLMDGIPKVITTYGQSERNKYRAVVYSVLTKHFGKERAYT